MRLVAACSSLLALSAVCVSSIAFGYGEPVDGYPSPEERQMLVLINRVRADPNNVEVGNASECSTPYDPVPPAAYDLALARAARFHTLHLARNGGGLSHASFCDLSPEIAGNGCDGAAACSCLPATECWSCDTLGGCGTNPMDRAAIFGHEGIVGEIGAANYGPLGAPSGWATECPPHEGHRTIITKDYLTTVGTGYAEGGSCWDSFEFADFGDGGRPPRIASAADFGGVIEANYYDAAGDPSSIDAVIDGVCHPMAVNVGTVPGNRDYTVSYAVTGDCQQFYVVARDTGGELTRYPTVGSLTIGCEDAYVPTQLEADCAPCDEGEIRPCLLGDCDGEQLCVAGAWGECNAPAECGSGGSGGGKEDSVGSGDAATDSRFTDADEACGCRSRGSARPHGAGIAVGLVGFGLAVRRRSRARRR